MGPSGTHPPSLNGTLHYFFFNETFPYLNMVRVTTLTPFTTIHYTLHSCMNWSFLNTNQLHFLLNNHARTQCCKVNVT